MKYFNQVNLETPESVELEFSLAGIGNRVHAFLIDYVIWLSVVFFCQMTVAFLIFNYLIQYDSLSQFLLAIQLFIVFVIQVGYFVFFETIWQGQTPGKRRAKIRVIQDDGRPVQLQQATIRSLLRPVDDLLFVGMFFIIFTKREKRIGDFVAGTLVVQEEAVSDTNISLSTEATTLAKELPTVTDLSCLLPEDFAIIRDYLQRRKGMIPSARKEVSLRLASQIKEIVSLERVPSGVTANQFLEAVYLAYQEESL
ncbi:MAG: RDD family protein [Spirulinaceae cyanobacterium]